MLNLNDAALTSEESYVLWQHYISGLAPSEKDHSHLIAEAQLRKAMWTLHSIMETMALANASTKYAWGHCAENLRLWLEAAGIEPW